MMRPPSLATLKHASLPLFSATLFLLLLCDCPARADAEPAAGFEEIPGYGTRYLTVREAPPGSLEVFNLLACFTVTYACLAASVNAESNLKLAFINGRWEPGTGT